MSDGYLLKASSTDFGNISDPVDGAVETAGPIVKYANYGPKETTLGPLSGNTTWYVQIYPYTNAGNTIDYKIDAPHQTSITLD